MLENTAKKYAKLNPKQYHASAYGLVASKRGHQKPVGEWNYQEVVVRKQAIVVHLNSTKILDTDLSKVTENMKGKKVAPKQILQEPWGSEGMHPASTIATCTWLSWSWVLTDSMTAHFPAIPI